MVTNVLGYYVPEFYAQEALIHLYKALGMANAIHMGYDAERKTFGKGDKINIKSPSTFTTASAPGSSQDIETKSVQMTLDNWREVRFELTDKELAESEENVIADHIAPAAYALADYIDQQLVQLYLQVPWFYDLNATPGSVVTDVTGPRQVLFDNAVPLKQMERMFFMVDGSMEAGLLGNAAFGQWQGAGQEGVRTQVSGAMGMRFGLNFFANQNVPTHTGGVCADAVGAIDNLAGYAKGVSTIHIDGVTDGGTWVIGDTFVIAGNTQRYAVTANVTFTGAEGDVSFTPPLAAAVVDDVVVTGSILGGVQNMAFHRNAFAIAFGQLPFELPNELGARVFSVQDPVTNLAIRARLYYDGDNSKVVVVLDVLFGVKTLDGNLACRAVQD